MSFDIDLAKGKFAENELSNILCSEAGPLVEVKRDFVVSTTGNIAIEYEQRGRPSGIAITTANWWAFRLDGPKFRGQVWVIIETERLKRLCRHYYGVIEKDVLGGDDKEFRIILLPITDIFLEVGSVKVVKKKCLGGGHGEKMIQ